jgi:hypothetical protein
LLRHQQMGVLPAASDSIIKELFAEISTDSSNKIKQIAANYAIARYVEVIYGSDGKRGSIFSDDSLFELYKYLPDDFMLQDNESQLTFMQKIPLSKNFRIQDMALSQLEGIKPDEQAIQNLSLALRFIGRSDFFLDILTRVKKTQAIDLITVKTMINDTINKLLSTKTLAETIFSDEKTFEYSPTEKMYINEPFPIAFIVEDESLLEPVQYEYRSKTNLILGQNIKLIATEAQHLEQLTAFCSQHAALQSLQICTIEQLRESLAPEKPISYKTTELLSSFGKYSTPTHRELNQDLLRTLRDESMKTSVL